MEGEGLQDHFWWACGHTAPAHGFCCAHSEEERGESSGAKDHQMVEMQWGNCRCIQREVDIRL